MADRQRYVPASSNGRTPRFGRGNRGSNPCAGANNLRAEKQAICARIQERFRKTLNYLARND